MPRSLITIIIILIFVISRVIRWTRRMQEQTQKERRRAATPNVKMPWEFEQTREIPMSREEVIRAETPARQPRKVDDEFRPLVDKSTVPDEETFKEEAVPETRSSERRNTVPHTRKEPVVPPRHKPVKIAGIPLTPQTISQGIIISEILRRPKS